MAITKLLEKYSTLGGCIISEYDNTIPPQNFTFLARNRIIAGISIATIVIEAPLKSGALNTASHAFDYKRKVFAVPYSLDYFKGHGCNFLLQNGAEPLVDISQIYDLIDHYTDDYHITPLPGVE